MNAYAVVILFALLGEFAVHLVADLLNLRALRSELPPEVRGVGDAETYRRSQEYTRTRTRFELVPRAVDLIAVLVFWAAGGFDWLDQLVRGAGWGPIGTGLLFVGALALAGYLLSLPFEVYSTFVIEARFGFNRTDARTFWGDQLKGLALGALLGLPLLAAILFFLDWAGAAAWLWCWGVAAVFILGLQVAAPIWILPLFNEFEPLRGGPLRSALLEYARGAGFPLEDVYVMDGSKRSTKSNAFFTGFGKHKRVALFDTLIEKHTTPELVGVLAHEIGHYRLGHVLRTTGMTVLELGLLFWLMSLFLGSPPLFEAFGMTERSDYAGLVFFALLYTPAQMALSTLTNAYSRRCEFEADAFAARTTGRPEALVSALVKLSVDNLSNLTPHPLHVWLHASHPPLLRRIRALRA